MLKLLLGDPNTRKLKRYQPIVEEINFLEEEISQLTDDELRKETQNLKSNISEELDFKKQKDLLEEFLPKAFAIVREASKRVLDMRHFDVQLIGGMVLNECQIAEMKTGEGKTLVATLPCYLNALTGKGVHVVTVNDYSSSCCNALIYNVCNKMNFRGLVTYAKTFVGRSEYTKVKALSTNSGRDKFIRRRNF